MRLSKTKDGPSSGTASSAMAKPRLRILPAPRPISRERRRIAAPQLILRRGQSPATAHDFVHRLWTRLTEQRDAIDLSRFDRGAGRRDRRLRHQDTAVVQLIGAFQAGRQIDRLAHHGIVHHHFRTDTADERFASSDPDADIERDRDVLQSDQVRQLGSKRRDVVEHIERGKGGETRLIGIRIERRSPIGHDGVADIFVDDAAVLADRRRHRRKIPVHHFDQALRRHFLADADETPAHRKTAPS